MIDFPILSLLVLVPAVGALLVAVLSKRQPDLVKATALLSSVLAGGLALLGGGAVVMAMGRRQRRA